MNKKEELEKDFAFKFGKSLFYEDEAMGYDAILGRAKMAHIDDSVFSEVINGYTMAGLES